MKQIRLINIVIDWFILLFMYLYFLSNKQSYENKKINILLKIIK